MLGFRDAFGFVGGRTRNSSSGAFGEIISLTTIAGSSGALLGGNTISAAYDLYSRRASSSARSARMERAACGISFPPRCRMRLARAVMIGKLLLRSLSYCDARSVEFSFVDDTSLKMLTIPS